MELKELQKDLTETIKSSVDQLGAEHKAHADAIQEKLSEQDQKIREVADKVAKVEAAAVEAAPKVIQSSNYKGYNLNHQLRKARNIAGKNPNDFSALADEEKVTDYSKYLIDIIRLKKHNDLSAIDDIKAYQQKAAMQEGTDSEGGYLVPDELAFDIVKLSRDRTFALTNCKLIEMGSDTLKLPSELTLPSVSWTAEETAATQSEGTYDQVTLTAKKLDAFSIVSNELLMDSAVDVVGILTEQFGYGVALELDNQVLNGTGDPVSGVLTAKAGYSVSLSAGSTNFSAVTADALSEAIYKVDEGFAPNGKFVFNKLIQHYVRILKDTTNNYIWANPGNGVPGTVWEYPYIISSQAPSTSGATTAFAVFGDFQYFYIGRRKGFMSLDVDPYSKFKEYQTQFRVITRWGLSVAQPKAFCRILTA